MKLYRFSFYLLAALLFIACSKQDKATTADKNAVTKNVFEANGSIDFNNDPSYLRTASLSAEKTFGKKLEVTIMKVEVQQFPEGRIQTIHYKTAGGQKSTYVVIENSTTQKKVTIDCYGTCDCRERVILDPATGNPTAYECTCAQCKMDVITTEN